MHMTIAIAATQKAKVLNQKHEQPDPACAAYRHDEGSNACPLVYFMHTHNV
jgi:hypothetical protein